MRWTLDEFSDAAVRRALIEALRADGGTIFRSILQSCLANGQRRVFEQLISIPELRDLGRALINAQPYADGDRWRRACTAQPPQHGLLSPQQPPPQPASAAAASAAAASTASAAAASAASVATATTVAAAAMVAAAAASEAVTAASVATVAAVAAASDKLYVGVGFSGVFLVKYIERRQGNVGDFLLTESDFVALSGVFLVKYIERRQGNVGDFLLTESDFVALSGVPRRYIRCRATGHRGCAARQRQRQPRGPQYW
jgi:hypothetical protein